MSEGQLSNLRYLRHANSKRAFLACYKREIPVRHQDGTVGKVTVSKWAYVLAASADEIETRYTELEPSRERPFWIDDPMEIAPGITKTMDEMLREQYTFDITEVEAKWLSRIRAEA